MLHALFTVPSQRQRRMGPRDGQQSLPGLCTKLGRFRTQSAQNILSRNIRLKLFFSYNRGVLILPSWGFATPRSHLNKLPDIKRREQNCEEPGTVKDSNPYSAAVGGARSERGQRLHEVHVSIIFDRLTICIFFRGGGSLL